MKQIEIKTTVYLIAEVPDDYEPQLGLSVEDGCASMWMRHNEDAYIVGINAEGQEVIHEENIFE